MTWESTTKRLMLLWLVFNVPALTLAYFWQPFLWHGILLFVVTGLAPLIIAIVTITSRSDSHAGISDEPLDPTLQIANQTLPFLRRGLNEETAG
ncbi:MAG: sensor histidine kinase, partial [Desulfotomaculaceae bacterium]